MDWADRIGRRIKLRDLHILLAVAECGSMAKASSQLSVSHPVVSKTISELERTLGVRLLDRSSQGVELTAHGAALLNCGVTVFNETPWLEAARGSLRSHLWRTAGWLPGNHRGRPAAGDR